MRKSLVFGAGQGARLAVLDLIKRSANGLGVKQIAAELGMSYMGVKAHCLALASKKYLTTWRQPAPKGRPLMFYRLTESGERLFAEPGLELALGLLRDAEKLFGSSAPQKLLALHYRAEAERYNAMISSTEVTERIGPLSDCVIGKRECQRSRAMRLAGRFMSITIPTPRSCTHILWRLAWRKQ